MLTQLEIDKIAKGLQEGMPQYLYYVAHYVETREGVIDESQYKSVARFRVIKTKVTSVTNAYLEVKHYWEHKELYDIEEEIEMYDANTEYKHFYVVPIANKSYSKPLNPRMPSIIYGVTRTATTLDGTIHYNNDDSPVKPIYTNALEYAGLTDGYVKDEYGRGNLDWKYITLSTPAIVDGIEYKYITSDWFIIETENFPRTEHPLVKAGDKCAYFMNPQDAFNFIKECEA